MDVASFYMGGPQIISGGGYDLDTIREYEEETGKKAFLSNSPTRSFKEWFKARQTREVMLEKVDGLVKSVVDDYMESLDRSKLQFRQLHFQDYVSDPSDVDRIYNNRKKYVWTGVVYRITELKEENGKKVEGRKIYGFTTRHLEDRWESYKSNSLGEDRRDLPLHNAILAIAERHDAGEINGDIDDWFKREVIEVHWDANSMRRREIYWIDKDNTQDPSLGFNTNSGGGGGSKVHIPVRLLADCIARGLKVKDIKIELEYHGIYVTLTTIHNKIKERYGSFLEARKVFLKPVIKQLIAEGYKQYEIYAGFKSGIKQFTAVYLIPQLFGVPYSALRKEYLLKSVTTILRRDIQGLTYEKICSFLPQFGEYEIGNLIRNKWGSLLSAKKQFGREIAIYLFRKGASDEFILELFGHSAFRRLFDGMTADEAYELFTSEYKNVENHFRWYSDLDNY